MSQTIIDVKKCSACGQDHDNIQTVEAVEPVRTVKRQRSAKRRPAPKRFFICPTTGTQTFVVQTFVIPKLTLEPPPEK